MASQSPAWKNPRERLVKHTKRKSSSRSLKLSKGGSLLEEDINTESCPPITSNAELNENPFKLRSPRKKKSKISDETPLKELPFDWDDSAANDSFSSTATFKMQQIEGSPKLGRSKSMQTFGESLDFSGIDGLQSTSNSPVVFDVKVSTDFPYDNRLGTKVRIISKVPYPWMKNIKAPGNVLVRIDGQERSQGMQCFLDYQEASSNSKARLPKINAPSLLEAASLYWQYPALPWLNFYPRSEKLLKVMPKQHAPPLAPTMTELINKQWFDSFSQLFISWKKGSRKNFYVACPSFTVFFNKTSPHDCDEPTDDSVSCFQLTNGQKHVAIISPTNLGLRQYLKSEGVEFELCSYKRRRLSRLKIDDSSMDSTDCSRLSSGAEMTSDNRDESIGSIDKENSEKSVNPNLLSDHEEESPTKGTNGVQEWLEDIGVSPRNQLKLKRHKSMISTITTLQGKGMNPKDVDKDITSAVIITEGGSLQALFNLLQNSKVTRTIAGSYANLPPTLLASKPFLFSQMLSLNKRSQIIKNQGHNTEYILELDGGPIMPHTVELVAGFLRTAKLMSKEDCTVRVSNRKAYDGLNGIDQNSEWNEIKVGKDFYSFRNV